MVVLLPKIKMQFLGKCKIKVENLPLKIKIIIIKYILEDK